MKRTKKKAVLEDRCSVYLTSTPGTVVIPITLADRVSKRMKKLRRSHPQLATDAARTWRESLQKHRFARASKACRVEIDALSRAAYAIRQARSFR